MGSVFLGVTLYAAMVLLLSACATGGGQSLMVDTHHVPAVGYLPDEITAMLEDLGYALIPESDAERAAQNFEEYKLQFKARDEANVRVDVHFRLVDKLTGIHLYNADEKAPSAATTQRYNALKKRVEREFGVDSVSDNHPLRIP